jgi:NADH-quinone oxidoreductase subunit F
MIKNSLVFTEIDPEIIKLSESHACSPDAILEIFKAIQGQRGGLTEDSIADVARSLGIPAERAYGVASFYSMLSTTPTQKKTIRICDGPPCWLEDSGKLFQYAQSDLGDGWEIERSSCLGLCDRAPAALVEDAQCGPLTKDNIKNLATGWRGEQRSYTEPHAGETRILLKNLGKLDPLSIQSAMSFGSYKALNKALTGPPEAVIEEVEAAGIRGRGGAGFPAGQKWRFVARDTRAPKYIVCNADESEPLVFKDRVLMETNPHQILEGILLAGYAVGAEEGFIYIRGEYEAQAIILEKAIQQASEHGFLGEKILNSDFSFHIHLHRGAGAYICGEETALLESLEGRRGEPRVRPPYPTVYGYKGFPTVVNNVETFASVPPIMLNGSAWYQGIGNPDNPGTKIYTLLGHVATPGLFEAPFGLTLRHIIDTFGGGMKPGSEFHFALTGGAAGTIVPPDLLDLPIDFRSTPKGISLGAGAILVCDQTVSPASLLRELMFFFEVESCGKCTPCRIGTRQSRETLDRIIANAGLPGDFELLKSLSNVLERDSFCGLGQFAAMPLNSAMKHFPESFKVGGERK